ncbi:MAG TPA: hypothetical protein VFT68_19555 [Lapillicoccus sp.]|nr:hypothetical protein [Lapillicoccus sp.]
MSYDIFFVRRDPGQTFEDALDDLEGSFEGGDPGELTDVDLEHWDAILPLAQEILGEVEVDDEDEETRELTAVASGVELTMIQGEIAIRVPDERSPGDDLELMQAVYDLAHAVEDVTGLEGYDPQLGEPVSDRPEDETPTRRRWPDDAEDESDTGGRGGSGAGARTLTGAAAADPRPEMAPDVPRGPSAEGSRRWWEFWKS